MEELRSFANADDTATVLASSGFIEELTMNNKHKDIQYITLNDVIMKRKMELDQLRNGLNTPFNLLDYLKNHPAAIQILFPSLNDIRYTSEDVRNKLKPVYQDQDSKSQKEDQTFSWLMQYLAEISDAKGGTV